MCRNESEANGRYRASLKRLGQEQLALGQLHWSVAKYAPPLERALWDGLVSMYEEVIPRMQPASFASVKRLLHASIITCLAKAILEAAQQVACHRAFFTDLCLIQGLVKAVGVSNYGPRQLEKIHKYLSDRGVPLASAQVGLLSSPCGFPEPLQMP